MVAVLVRTLAYRVIVAYYLGMEKRRHGRKKILKKRLMGSVTNAPKKPRTADSSKQVQRVEVDGNGIPMHPTIPGRNIRGHVVKGAVGPRKGKKLPWFRSVSRFKDKLRQAVIEDEEYCEKLIATMKTEALFMDNPMAKRLILEFLIGKPKREDPRSIEAQEVAHQQEVELQRLSNHAQSIVPNHKHTKPTDQLIADTAALAALGCSLKTLPGHLGVRPTTLDQWMAKGENDIAENKETVYSRLVREYLHGTARHQARRVVQQQLTDGQHLAILERTDPDSFGRRLVSVEEEEGHEAPDSMYE